MNAAQKYLRPRAIARQLGVTERTVRRWIASGELPSVKIGGARLVSTQALEALLGRSETLEDEEEDEDEDAESEHKQYQMFIRVSGMLCPNNRSIYFVIVFPNVTVCHGLSQYR